MIEERTDVIVIGGGQAALVAGYYLQRAELPFAILAAVSRVGDSWRRRWDSLELFTAARYSSLPGLRFPGDPEHFPNKEEVADYLEAYAQHFQLPVRLGTRVSSLQRSDDGYRLQTDSGASSDTFEAQQVIVATGAYQQPYVPPVAQRLSSGVAQLHSADYRNPDQIPRGNVLVVGAANSGAGIAEDLSRTHRVYLSRGKRIPRMPRRILGKSLHWYGDHLGLIAAPLDSWRGRTQRGDILVGQSLGQLSRRRGVKLLGRTVDADGRTVRIDDGTEIEVDAVIWSTGYRPDYSWIDVPVFDESERPRHERGVTDSPGLYFVGMKDQYSRGSSLIYWVREDAEHIVDRVRESAASASLG